MTIRDEQLKKCEFADLSDYDSETRIYHIPKYNKPIYIIGKCYIVKVHDNVINNLTSVTATNWNHCTAPNNQYLKIYVSKSLGKMIYMDSIAYDINSKQDLNTMWSGWLSVDDIDQIAII